MRIIPAIVILIGNQGLKNIMKALLPLVIGMRRAIKFMLTV